MKSGICWIMVYVYQVVATALQDYQEPGFMNIPPLQVMVDRQRETKLSLPWFYPWPAPGRMPWTSWPTMFPIQVPTPPYSPVSPVRPQPPRTIKAAEMVGPVLPLPPTRPNAPVSPTAGFPRTESSPIIRTPFVISFLPADNSTQRL